MIAAITQWMIRRFDNCFDSRRTGKESEGNIVTTNLSMLDDTVQYNLCGRHTVVPNGAIGRDIANEIQ
jgi:hypothetical protein